MSVDVSERVEAATRELLDGVIQSFDLAADLTAIPTYHIADHTSTATKELLRWASLQRGLFTDNQVFALLLGEVGHDTIQYEFANGVNEDVRHPLFIKTRVRNQTGVAEDDSRLRLLEVCHKHDIPEEIIALAEGIPPATTVAFIDGQVTHTRLTEIGDPKMNYFGAKGDTMHGMRIRDRLVKQGINTRFFLEKYPDAAKALIEGTFTFESDEAFEWVRGEFATFSGKMQCDFARSQFRQAHEDAIRCGLGDKYMDLVTNVLFTPKVLEEHLLAIDAIAKKVTQTPESVLAAFTHAVQPIIINRRALNHTT